MNHLVHVNSLFLSSHVMSHRTLINLKPNGIPSHWSTSKHLSMSLCLSTSMLCLKHLLHPYLGLCSISIGLLPRFHLCP
ncbi:hypothetical protein AQUCO_01700389v1 [Aquilegia coerulea]|uniref:Uncharacterized protein n=1 Tax=Aquilegia coerulea TaxID=218851 RepID=A0A2G5DND9_AQUCA|nr:hypothetical protein AQUCO_01700389v1 [Aquilegia coerulea]